MPFHLLNTLVNHHKKIVEVAHVWHAGKTAYDVAEFAHHIYRREESSTSNRQQAEAERRTREMIDDYGSGSRNSNGRAGPNGQYGEDAPKEGMGGGTGGSSRGPRQRRGEDVVGTPSPSPPSTKSGLPRKTPSPSPPSTKSGLPRKKRRGEDVVRPLRVSLDDLYNGTSKKLSFSRTVICSKCKGKESKYCLGLQGVETINEQNRCPQCKGYKVVREKKVLEVVVEKGMQNGHRITLIGEADEKPNTITGDIVLVLQQEEHPKFKRRGDDLFVEHTLTLIEAVCGFQFILTHLDNRHCLIKSLPGDLFKHDQLGAINDEGMPMYQRPFFKGKLYIHFTVNFPESPCA